MRSKTALFVDNKAVANKFLLLSFVRYGTIYPVSDYCEPDPDDTCERYDALTGLCAACKPGHYLDQQACVPANEIDGCWRYSALDVCAECVRHSYLRTQGAETSCHPNPVDVVDCARFSDALTCAQCPPAYWPAGLYCRRDPAFPAELADESEACLVMQKNTDPAVAVYAHCVACKTGFMLNDDKVCVDITFTHRHCHHLRDNACTHCVHDYGLLNELCVSVQELPALSDAMLSCLVMDAQYKCTQCSPEKTLIGDACFDTVVAHCVVHAAAGDCALCESGYAQHSATRTCVAVAVEVPNCLHYVTDSAGEPVCVVCKAEFNLKLTPRNAATPADGLVSAECVAVADVNCAVFRADGTCAGCSTAKPLLLQDGRCAQAAAADLECLVPLSAGGCDICTEGHVAVKDAVGVFVCQPISSLDAQAAARLKAECKLHRADGSCAKCTDGHSPNAAEECSASAPDDPAQADDEFCVSVRLVTGVSQCELCFRSRPTTADGLTRCRASEIIKPTECEYSEVHMWGASLGLAFCRRCNAGFTLDRGQTCRSVAAGEQVDVNCLLAHVDDVGVVVCDMCNAQHRRGTDGRCAAYAFAPDPHCEGTHVDARCLECAVGYAPRESDGVCVALQVPPVANCLAHSASGICLRCQVGYVDVGGSCVESIALCITSAGLTACVECKAPHYPDAAKLCTQTSTALIQDCEVYDGENSCAACKNGHPAKSTPESATNDVCVAVEAGVSHCASLHSTYDAATDAETLTCVGCEGDYYLRTESDGTVVCARVLTVVLHCASYDASQVCVACEEGHLLIADAAGVAGKQVCQAQCVAQAGGLCTACAPLFYLSEDKLCVEVFRAIEACVEYRDEVECARCEENFTLTGDGSSCLSDRQIAYCTELGEVQCLQCESKHQLNNQSECHAIQQLEEIDNCELQVDPGVCAGCKKGFFIAEAGTVCRRNPEPKECYCIGGKMFIWERLATPFAAS